MRDEIKALEEAQRDFRAWYRGEVPPEVELAGEDFSHYIVRQHVAWLIEQVPRAWIDGFNADNGTNPYLSKET